MHIIRTAGKNLAVVLSAFIIGSIFTAHAFCSVTTIYPAADSYVALTSPNTNNGTVVLMTVYNYDPLEMHYSYIYFNSGDIPPYPINSATLYLYSNVNLNNPHVIGEACASSWSETTVNYNNRPGVTGTQASFTITGATGWYSMDITSIVQGWVAVNYGMQLRTDTFNAYSIFNTREDATAFRPYLVIDYTGPPMPTNTPTFSPTQTFTRTPTATPTTMPGSSLPEAVDNLALSITTGGNASWYGQTAFSYLGGDSARSGAIGHGQSTYMETTVTGPGMLYFYWNVSSESCCDYLRFYINGVQQAQIAGTPGWAQRSYYLAAGTNTLRWTYSKDGSVVAGSDCGWVDAVNFIYGTVTSTSTFTPTGTRTNTLTPTVTRTPTQTPAPVFASYPFFDGYETGSFAGHWQLYASNSYSGMQVINTYTPRTGTYHAALAGNSGGNYCLNEMILCINLTGAVNPYLQSWVKSTADEPHALPASFTGHYNGDGIAVSGNGVNWYTIVSLVSVPSSYTGYGYYLMPILTAAGITNLSQVYIKFQQYDNYYLGTDGLLFDDISVAEAVPPTVTYTPSQTRTSTVTFTPTVGPTPDANLAEAVDYYGMPFITYGNGNWYRQTAFSYYDGDSARSGAITSNQSTSMEAALTGPGTLGFYWNVSSESCCDYLTFYIDGVQQTYISGSPGWSQRTYSIGSGAHTVRWTYSKDGSVNTGTDCGWVDLITYTGPTPTYTATRTFTRTPTGSNTPTNTFTPTYTNTFTATRTFTVTNTPTATIPIAETLDNTDPEYTLTGDAQWYGQTAEYYYDNDAARSGAVGDSRQCGLKTFIDGPCTLSFYWKVSSETNYDFLIFYVDDTERARISGDTQWDKVSLWLSDSRHTVRWEYIKDATGSSGSDCGWVDKIEIIPGAAPGPTGTPTPSVPYPVKNGSYVYPNPARGRANFVFELAEAAHVSIQVYNAAGEPAATVVTEAVRSRTNSASLDVSGFAPGIYYYVIHAGYYSGSDAKLKPGKFLVVK